MISIPGKVSQSERNWAILCAVVVMLITTIPYLLGYQVQNENWTYTGFVFGVEDGNSYIAKMLTGASGSWLFRSPYSNAAQTGVIAFLPYLLLGKLTSVPAQHDQLVALFHIFRFVSGILAFLATYDFIAYFVSTIKWRKMGVFLASLGGGLGWFVLLLGHDQLYSSLPLEFYSPETFGFLSLFGIPHLSLARAGLLWGILAYLQAVQNKGDSRFLILKVNGLWLLTALAQPLTAIILGYGIGLYLAGWLGWILISRVPDELSQWGASLKKSILCCSLVLPFLTYNAIRFATDPFLTEWTRQNIIRSPNPIHYLLAYGLILPLAVGGIHSVYKNNRQAGLFLILWMVSLPVLAYLPLNLQRRFPEGIWVVLVTLSMSFFATGYRGRIQIFQNIWRFVILLAYPSTLFLFAGAIAQVMQPRMPLFRPSEEIVAFQSLAQISEPGATVLTSYTIGNVLPAWVPVRVVLGHGPETIHFADLETQINKFFDAQTDDRDRKEFIVSQGVDYIYWGPNEQDLGGWYPDGANWLDKLFDQDGIAIYRVR